MWNSIHAHLSGEFFCSPKRIGPAQARSGISPDREDMMAAALVHVVNRLQNKDLVNEPELFDIMDELTEKTSSKDLRVLRVGEIREILTAMNDAPNRRKMWRS